MASATSRQKVVLLNPPGDQRYLRDYFCAKVAKSYYYYHPIDLVYISGTISVDFDVEFIDAIAEGLSAQACKNKIAAAQPDWVLFLTAGISFVQDMAFLEDLKVAVPTASLIGIGDVYREIGEAGLRDHAFVDALLLDFSTQDIITYLRGERGKAIPNLIYRDDDAILNGKEVHGRGRFHLPMPRWDLVKLPLYRYPFERRREFASMITDFGCAFKCTFCPLSTVGFKLRDLEEVEKELKLLKGMGVREIYFRDQTFGTNRKRTLDLCAILKPLGLGWTCFSRVDVLTEDLLVAMKGSGCHTVMFGFETANDEILAAYDKNTSTIQADQAVALCRSYGIDVVGFFIIGLPGESRESVLATIDFACKSGIDFASFNMAVPRLGSTMRKDAIEAGTSDQAITDVDSSNSQPSWKGQSLSNQEIVELQKIAFRKFYLRPSYILKRLRRIATPHQLWSMVREGIFLVGRKAA